MERLEDWEETRLSAIRAAGASLQKQQRLLEEDARALEERRAWDRWVTELLHNGASFTDALLRADGLLEERRKRFGSAK
jgi:hypothetical protein